MLDNGQTLEVLKGVSDLLKSVIDQPSLLKMYLSIVEEILLNHVTSKKVSSLFYLMVYCEGRRVKKELMKEVKRLKKTIKECIGVIDSEQGDKYGMM